MTTASRAGLVVVVIATALPALCLVSAEARAGAEPGPHEVYMSSGFGYYKSSTRVVAGIGGGPGYRLNVSRNFSFYAEGKWLFYVGNAFIGVLGVAFRFRHHWWEPIVALQGAAFGGNRLEILTSSSETRAPAMAFAVQGRLTPLRFTEGSVTASALGFDFGFGYEGGSLATAIGISLAEVGVRF